MKRFFVIFLVSAMVLGLVGCGGKVAENSSTVSESVQESEAELKTEQYTLNENATILTLACFCLTEKEAQIVDAFNLTHTDYQIEILSYYDGDSDHYKTAQTKMKVALLTGDAPDLYSLNSMDIVSMEREGLLMDLYPLMDADESFDRDDYFMNVWDQYAWNGALYEFVPSFAVRGLVGPKALVGDRTGWTYDEMEAWIADADSQHKTATEEVPLQYMIQGSCAAYLDFAGSTCRFQTESFSKWMTLVQQFSSVEDEDNALLGTANAVGVNSYLIHKAYYQDTPVYMGFPSEQGDGPYATAIDSFAISSSTKYPEVCWEFLTSLMDGEQLEWFLGIPMQKSILEQQLSSAMLDPSDPEFPLQTDAYALEALTQEEVDTFLNMVSSIDHTKLRYDGVTDLISEEVELWLSGSQTQEQTMEYLQNRVGTYLSEQQ
jgi:multiple sugar transport system substrate-binding protein